MEQLNNIIGRINKLKASSYESNCEIERKAPRTPN